MGLLFPEEVDHFPHLRKRGFLRYREVLGQNWKKLYLANLLALLSLAPFAAGMAYALLSQSILVLIPTCIIGGLTAGPGLSGIPAGHAIRSKPHHFSEQLTLDDLLCKRHIQKHKAFLSLGTLGGGNHFIEVDQSEDGSYWLIIHSGSRHLGVEVASYYQKESFAHTTPEGIPFEFACATSSLMEDYLHDMKIAQDYASLNRKAIAFDIAKGMKLDVEDQIETMHNYIDTEEMFLRKGAVSAKAGERLLIPMNMRDGSLLCVGKGNPEWNYSAPHGAGRLMSRSESQQSFTLSQFKKEMKGVFSSSVRKDTLDESPMAYKPMEEILSHISPTVKVIEQIRPIYNFKARAK